MGMFVQISPPGALINASRVDETGCLGPLFYIPRTILKISDAQVHQRGARGRQYVVCLVVSRSRAKGDVLQGKKGGKGREHR